ncbi:MAG: hypothetical protein JSV24_09580 [Bacteroidales bacterium]|nr:MAG: hypothetical protein JSV24_09580 [Bacteroidales bacterium]
MQIKEQLETEISRWNTDQVTWYIGRDPDRFLTLWDLIFPETYPVSPRAAWVAESCCIKYPHLLKPYLNDLISRLPGIRFHGIKRHMIKILTYQDIPEKYLGQLVDLCFAWIQASELPVSVKVHCMQVLYNILPQFPELEDEFIVVVNDQIPKNSAGFRTRAKKLLTGMNTIHR